MSSRQMECYFSGDHENECDENKIAPSPAARGGAGGSRPL